MGESHTADYPHFFIVKNGSFLNSSISTTIQYCLLGSTWPLLFGQVVAPQGLALTEASSGLYSVHSTMQVLSHHHHSDASARSIPNLCGSLGFGLYKALWYASTPLLHLGHPGLTCGAA